MEGRLKLKIADLYGILSTNDFHDPRCGVIHGYELYSPPYQQYMVLILIPQRAQIIIAESRKHVDERYVKEAAYVTCNVHNVHPLIEDNLVGLYDEYHVESENGNRYAIQVMENLTPSMLNILSNKMKEYGFYASLAGLVKIKRL
jgi:hypothetical protein